MSLLAPDYSLLAVIAAFVAGVVVGRLTGAAADPRRREERRARHSGATSPAEIVQLLPAETRIEIETLVADDRKIEAIRVCRAALGLDLKEAKEAVDLIERTTGRGARAP
jgi:ribosomal protein L7/L12